MSKGKPESIRRRTRYGWDDFCPCGARLGEPGHNRKQCLAWLRISPSPGRGHRLPGDIPTRLHDEAEDAHISKDLERYLDRALGQHKRLLVDLARRSPYWAHVYVQREAHDRSAADIARELSETLKRRVPQSTVRDWHACAARFVRDWRTEREARLTRTLPLDPSHDPSDEARRKEVAALIQLNEEHMAVIQGRAIA